MGIAVEAVEPRAREWRDDGGQRSRWGGGRLIFFPPCGCEAAILEEGVGDHRHERVTVKALPGPALEVIEAKFFFQLLVCLLADRSALIVVAEVRRMESSRVGWRETSRALPKPCVRRWSQALSPAEGKFMTSCP